VHQAQQQIVDRDLATEQSADGAEDRIGRGHARSHGTASRLVRKRAQDQIDPRGAHRRIVAPSRAANDAGNSARASCSIASTTASPWVGSWWNRPSDRAPDARAISAAATYVECPQPLRDGPLRPSYSDTVYCASYTSRSTSRARSRIASSMPSPRCST